MKTEVDKTPSITKALSSAGLRLFRNNVGAFTNSNGRKVFFGLCPGSSDCIGWAPVTITADMIGKQIAVFTAVEIKRDESVLNKWKKDKNQRAVNQRNFIEAVSKAGGIGFATFDAAHAIEQLRSCGVQNIPSPDCDRKA